MSEDTFCASASNTTCVKNMTFVLTSTCTQSQSLVGSGVLALAPTESNIFNQLYKAGKLDSNKIAFEVSPFNFSH